jgi:hypothetical protein
MNNDRSGKRPLFFCLLRGIFFSDRPAFAHPKSTAFIQPSCHPFYPSFAAFLVFFAELQFLIGQSIVIFFPSREAGA